MRSQTPGRPAERGATAVVVAIMLGVLAGFLALAINVGHLYSVRGGLQNGADSAALAGAKDLNGLVPGLSSSLASAGTFAGYHTTDTFQVVGSPIELGHWPIPGEPNACAAGEVETGTPRPPDYKKFCRVDARDATAALRINAVRVRTSRASDAPGGGAAPVYANGVLGASATSDVRSEAVAVSGAPCSSACGNMPFVLQEGCVLNRCATGGPLYYYVELSSNGLDTAGLTNLVPRAGVTPGIVCDILSDPNYCGDILHTSDQIYTANGTPLGAGPGCDEPSICATLKARVGQPSATAKVPLVMFPGDTPATCGAPQWNKLATIGSFATLKLVFVDCSPKDAPAVDPSLPSTDSNTMYANCYTNAPPGTNPKYCIVIELLCSTIDNGSGGCGWTGTTGKPKLVR